jgi:hypothetical protein
MHHLEQMINNDHESKVFEKAVILLLLQMVVRCVVGGCSNDSASPLVTLHKWPDKPYVAGKWNKFVADSRQDWKGLHKRPSICSDHFKVSHL